MYLHGSFASMVMLNLHLTRRYKNSQTMQNNKNNKKKQQTFTNDDNKPIYA